MIALLAKQEFGVPRVVARVNNPNNEWMFTELWGVDVAVSTPHLLTAVVEEAVNVGSFVRLLSLEGGSARLAEVTLIATSPAIGTEIAALGLPRESTVVALIRDRHVVVPRGDTVLRGERRGARARHGRRRGRRAASAGGLTHGRTPASPPRRARRARVDRSAGHAHRHRASAAKGEGVWSGHPHARPTHYRAAGARCVAH